MATISIPDLLLNQLGSLAKPFVDKEPADVIQRLVNEALKQFSGTGSATSLEERTAEIRVGERMPRERGAVIKIDGHIIRADSVPDLISKVMTHLHEKGRWSRVLELSPYKTSAQRYLYSKTPKHPNGNDFWVEIKCRDVVVEGHKNYKTAIDQLSKLVAKCGMSFSYQGAY